MPSGTVVEVSDNREEESSPSPVGHMVTACTIVARNYLPAARVLARSFARYHPNGRLVVLVVDDVHGEVEGEPFEVWRPEDLDLAPAEFYRMAGLYNVTELATAMKPWLLEALLARGRDSVIYLDPDMRVYDNLDEIALLARPGRIVLTPHVTHPMARDGKGPSETHILMSGMYNLGFIGLGCGAADFLAFWKERLRRECYIDHANHRFVDQRWMDFVPGLFDCHILRDTSYNVAYWNVDQRVLSWTGTAYLVDGCPLGLFHFSGYNPRFPYILSKHQGDHPRILLSEYPVVAQICEEYGTALTAEGWGVDDTPEYAFDTLPNGLQLSDGLRNLYRTWVAGAEDRGEEAEHLYSEIGAERFCAYLTTPQAGSRLPLYLQWEWGRRAGLRGRLPHPEGADYERLLFWAKEEVVNGRMHPRLVQWSLSCGGPDEVEATERTRWAPPGETVAGICVSGYLRAELGTGEAGRLVLEAVRRAGIPSGTFVYSNTASRQQSPLDESPRGDLNTNVLAINGDQMPFFGHSVGPGFFEGRYNIGFWAWELEDPPRLFEQGLHHLDEIWTVSDFSRASISLITDKPVYTFPYPISIPEVPFDLDREALGLPSGFIFLFCFDLLSTVERKNPIDLVSAFSRAFKPDEGPTLVIKAINGDRRRMDLERLRYRIGDRRDIVLLERYFDSDENAGLMAACDCYVSLHRSEGFGLTLAEAMALGKPVIATGYSGNLDFMDNTNSYLVSWKPSEVPPGSEPYPAGVVWAQPDVGEAARFMRGVVQDPSAAAAVGARARQDILRTNGIEAAVSFVANRFSHIQSQLGAAGRSDGGVPADRSVDVGGHAPIAAGTIPELAASPPSETPSLHPAMVRIARRMVHRVGLTTNRSDSGWTSPWSVRSRR